MRRRRRKPKRFVILCLHAATPTGAAVAVAPAPTAVTLSPASDPAFPPPSRSNAASPIWGSAFAGLRERRLAAGSNDGATAFEWLQTWCV